MSTWKPIANEEYNRRINRVIDYLQTHLSEAPKLEELAKVACFSEFHFHKIFTAVTGESVNNFTNRLRLEKAAKLLRFSERSITDIALDCGFSSSSTLSRSFKAHFGVTPRQLKKDGQFKNSKICKELHPIHEYLLPMSLEEKQKSFPVSLKKLPEWDIAYIRVLNSFEGDSVLKAYSKIIDWAKVANIYSEGTLFGMSMDDPMVTPQHLYRYDVCYATKKDFDCGGDISRTKLPSQTYATTVVNGDLRYVATAIDYLFTGWLINSEYEPEHAPGLEIYLNKNKALDWTNFELELCIPVKPLRRTYD